VERIWGDFRCWVFGNKNGGLSLCARCSLRRRRAVSLLGWEGRRAGASFELNGLFRGSGFFLLLDMYVSLEAMGNRQLPVLQTYGATTIDNMGEHSLNVPCKIPSNLNFVFSKKLKI
jgi:hypothetical protein